MTNMSIRHLFGASGLALAIAGAQPAFAAEPDSAASRSSGVQEIVVTAQKRTENLQTVPVAVSAITPELVKNARIENIADLRGTVPNLYVTTQPGGSSIPTTTMRGQVSGASSNPTVDNGVSYYIDGVYLGALNGILFDVSDIERIEVIRGPAGTLFGTNSTGGAVNYITSGPTGKFGITQDLSYARFNSFRTKTRIDLPEWNGISLSGSYMHNERKSNVRNFRQTTIDYTSLTDGKIGKLTSAERLGESETDAIHIAARAKPVDGLTINYKFDWTYQKSTPPPVYLIGFPSTPGGIGAYQTVASQEYFGGPTVDEYIQLQRGKVAYNDNTTLNTTKTTSHLLSIEYAANPWLTIKNTASWRSNDRDPLTSNLDGTGFLTVPIAFGEGGVPTAFAPFGLLTVRCCAQLRQFSNETQFSIDTDPLDVTAGLFYYTRRTLPTNPWGEAVVDAFQVYPGGAHPGTPLTAFDRSFTYRVKQAAAYGQATYHLTDTVDLTGGIRYTQDDKSFFDVAAGPPGSTFNYSKGNFSYLANVTWKPNSDLMVYGKYVTSFIAGGVSAGPLAVDSVTGKVFQGAAVPYGEETAKSWELGLKTDLLDKRLRANLAAFYVNYAGLQIAQFASSGCITSPSGNCEPIVSSSTTANIGKARAYGLEFELTAVPVDRLTLTAGGSYTHFEYQYIDPAILANGGVTRVEDYPNSQRPKFVANVAAQYEAPLVGDTSLLLRLDAIYRSSVVIGTAVFSKTPFDDAGLPYDPTYMNALNTQPSLLTLNARASVADIPLGSTTATISVWGRNITNKQQLNFMANTGITVAGLYDDPVTYGVDLTIKL